MDLHAHTNKRVFCSLISKGTVFSCLLMMSACKENDVVSESSATRGSKRYYFLDSLSWIDPDLNSCVICFFSQIISDEIRHLILQNKSPSAYIFEPMMEVKLHFKNNLKKDNIKMSTENLESLIFTFWNFDALPVIHKLNYKNTEKNTEIDIPKLEGDLKLGGSVIGSLRGVFVVKTSVGSLESFTLNVVISQLLSR